MNATGWLAVVLGVWVPGWCLTARSRFIRWRPARVALCGKTVHQHLTACRNTNGNVPGYYTCGMGDHAHSSRCYRRQRHDLVLVPIDSDWGAACWALAAAIPWPFLLGMMLFMRNPPELPEEKRHRVKAMEKEAGIQS